MLKRNGLSRPPRVAREPARRYEWPCPGDLLHMDVAHYARFFEIVTDPDAEGPEPPGIVLTDQDQADIVAYMTLL